MVPTDYDDFRRLLAGVHDFYGKDMSEFALGVWWEAARPYDLAAVRDALNRHVINPDTGQFLPRPADVARMIGGRTIDAALMAWAKVDRAVRQVGPYRSVVFDDALIHRVVEDMGGWIALSNKGGDEWPFAAREFETRYRGYAMRGETPAYLRRLPGIAERQNAQTGRPVKPPVLIGDETAARRVLNGGVDTAALPVHQVADVIALPDRRGEKGAA